MVLYCIVLRLCNMMMMSMIWIRLSIPTIECYHYYQIKFGIIFPFSNLTGNTWLVVSTSVFMKLWPDLPNQHRMSKSKVPISTWWEYVVVFFSFSQLKNLECLSLRANPMGNLPESVCEIKSLKILNLGKCELKKLPKRWGAYYIVMISLCLYFR